MVEILRHRITDASAWHGPALAGRKEWVMRPSPAMVAEMRDATLRVAGRGLGFTRADFPLPLTAPWLAEALEHVTEGRGFVLLRGLLWPSLLALFVAMVLAAAQTYLLSRYWAFRRGY